MSSRSLGVSLVCGLELSLQMGTHVQMGTALVHLHLVREAQASSIPPALSGSSSLPLTFCITQFSSRPQEMETCGCLRERTCTHLMGQTAIKQPTSLQSMSDGIPNMSSWKTAWWSIGKLNVESPHISIILPLGVPRTLRSCLIMTVPFASVG